MADWGVRLTGSSGVWHAIPNAGGGNLNQWGLAVLTAPVSGFVTRLDVWARRDGSNNGKPQLAIWGYSAGQATVLLGYTDVLTVSAGSSSAGVQVGGNLIYSRDRGIILAGVAVPIMAGMKYVVGIHNEGAGIELAVGASELSRFTLRVAKGAGLPSDPFHTSTASAVDIRPGSIVATYTPSTGPTATMTGPAALISTTTPLITATVTDPDAGEPYVDTLGSYLVEVRQVVAGVPAATPLWAPPAFTATTQEKSTGINRPYNGPALLSGDYQARVQPIDRVGVPGAWTAWRGFTLANAGIVDITGALPTGKQEAGIITQWKASWINSGGLSLDKIKVRINSGVNVLRGGDSMAWVDITNVAPGADIIVLDSVTKLTQGTVSGVPVEPLPSGTYTWQMIGLDTGGGTSSWSDPVPFNVNYAPNVPTALQPDSGSRSARRPVLSWEVSDNDEDDLLGSTLESQYRVTRLSNGSFLEGQTNNVDTLTGKGYIDVEANPSLMGFSDEDYQWTVRGVDLSAVAYGIAHSIPGLGYGPWATPALFRLILAPTVTINTPIEGATVSTSAPQITWTVTTGSQVFYRIDIFRTNEATPFRSFGYFPASSGSSGTFNIPPGVLENGTSYDLKVTILGPGDVESASLKRRITVFFETADTVNNFTAGTILMPGDFEANSVDLNWQISGYEQLQFAGYIVTRRLETQAASQALPIAFIRQAGQTNFTDFHPPPNTDLIYAVSQLRRLANGDVRQSVVSESTTINVAMTTPVIASAMPGRGGTLRAPVMFLGSEYAEGFLKEETLLPIWGSGGLPLHVRSPEGYGSIPIAVGILIMDDERGTLHQHMERWRSIVWSGHTVSVRTETLRLFMAIEAANDWLARTEDVGVWRVQFTLRQVYWNETAAITV